MITLRINQTTMNNGSFALVIVNDIKYVIPAWIPVPMETEHSDIVVDMPIIITPSIPLDRKWLVPGSKGAKYTVQRKNNIYTCDCPASMFRKSAPCKHINAVMKTPELKLGL